MNFPPQVHPSSVSEKSLKPCNSGATSAASTQSGVSKYHFPLKKKPNQPKTKKSGLFRKSCFQDWEIMYKMNLRTVVITESSGYPRLIKPCHKDAEANLMCPLWRKNGANGAIWTSVKMTAQDWKISNIYVYMQTKQTFFTIGRCWRTNLLLWKITREKKSKCLSVFPPCTDCISG